MGRHPFAGRYLGIGDMPIEQAIAEYRYAFGCHAEKMSMARPPQSLDVAAVTPELAPLFERAFGRGSEAASARPTAPEWHAALFTLAGKLAICKSDRGHRYPTDAMECPWCRLMLDGAPNFFLSVTFRGTTPEILKTTPDVAALLRAVETAPRPRGRPLPAPPTLEGFSPSPPPPAVENAQSLATMVRYVALGSLVASGGMLMWLPVGLVTVPIFVVFALWWLVMFLASGHRPERQRRRRIYRARRAELRYLKGDWQDAISAADMKFRAVQKELRTARDQLEKLKARHDTELRRLTRDVWQRQLNAFLQTKFISEAKIDGIGPGRTATLASYGIETAADVEYNSVLGVPGLDPATTNNLCAWRSKFERQFHVNKSQGVPASERQALLLKYAQMKQQLELMLRIGPRRLRELDTQLQAHLDELTAKIDTTYQVLAQAYVDAAAMSRSELRG